METRSLRAIAGEIQRTWPKVSPYAAPYIHAMRGLDKITDKYGQDSAEYIVRYFLSNAGTYRGEAARRIKAELKAMI